MIILLKLVIWSFFYLLTVRWLSKSNLVSNPKSHTKGLKTVPLNGENLILKSIKVDETELTSDDYILTEDSLTFHLKRTPFHLRSSRNKSESNTELEGLYLSSGILHSK